MEMMLVAVACSRPMPRAEVLGLCRCLRCLGCQSQHRGHQPLSDILRRHERIQSQRVDQLVSVAGQRRLHRGALVFLDRS